MAARDPQVQLVLDEDAALDAWPVPEAEAPAVELPAGVLPSWFRRVGVQAAQGQAEFHLAAAACSRKAELHAQHAWRRNRLPRKRPQRRACRVRVVAFYAFRTAAAPASRGWGGAGSI